jgi:hypothetical protein
MMHKKGQLVMMAVFFGLIIFVVLWALFFGEWINVWSQQMIVLNNLTGVEAFLMSNMNLWVGLGVVFGSVSYLYFGGGR